MAEGVTAQEFTITTSQVASETLATITASSGTSSKSTILSIEPPSVLAGLSLSPSTVVGGNSSTGTITLNAAAPTGGTIVNLNTSSANISAPATVTVAEGATTATFTVSTVGVTVATNESITASLNGAVKTAQLTLQPAGLANFTITPVATVGGVAASGWIGLDGAATGGGLVVKLVSNSSSAAVPTTVTIPAGATSVTFSITTSPVKSDLTATITASNGAVSLPKTLVVQAPQLVAVTVGPGQVIGGSQTVVTGTVVLSGATPQGGVIVTLTSSSAALGSVPTSSHVLGGQSSATFTVTHKLVSASKPLIITAKYGNNSSTTILSVEPFAVSSITVNPTLVTGGEKSTGTVTLNATPGAGSGAVAVKLSSNSSAVTLPATASVPIGSSSGKFAITTKAVTSSTFVNIVGKLGLSSSTASITVQQPFLESISLTPTTGKGSATTTVTGTVKLTGIAPTGGLTITLSSSTPLAASPPTTVKVLAGKNSATFKVVHGKVLNNTAVTITADLIGQKKTATLNVTP